MMFKVLRFWWAHRKDPVNPCKQDPSKECVRIYGNASSIISCCETKRQIQAMSDWFKAHQDANGDVHCDDLGRVYSDSEHMATKGHPSYRKHSKRTGGGDYNNDSRGGGSGSGSGGMGGFD